MPGAYLLAILAAAGGVAAIDARWRLAFWDRPAAATLAVACGTAILLTWDLIGIAAGIFIKGDSPLFLGLDLAPHLPVEEPFFLAFLCQLALTVWAVAQRRPTRPADGSGAP